MVVMPCCFAQSYYFVVLSKISDPVGSFPTTFFINPLGGHVIDMAIGFLSEEQLIKRMHSAIQVTIQTLTHAGGVQIRKFY